MNNEIKEILDRLDAEEFELPEYSSPISWTEMFEIRDYITNLQQAVKNTKETADDMLYELNEENERLKEKVKHYEETQTFGDYVKEVNLLVDYKSRIEKAVEYIERSIKESQLIFGWNDIQRYHDNEMNELLNILNGRSDK